MNNRQPMNILVVDDSRTHLKIVQAVLNPLEQTIITANSGEEAITCVKTQDFAVILMDVNLPGMDGFKTAAQIRKIERSYTTPIIFMTGLETSEVKIFQGYSQGAVDYLFKPIPPYVLKSKVAIFIQLYQQNCAITTQNTYIDTISRDIENKEIQIKEQAKLLDLTQDAIVICDLYGKIQFWNQGAIQLYGWKKSEALGQNYYELLNVKFDQSLEAIRKELILQEFWQGECSLVNKDNQALFIAQRWTLKSDKKGKPIGYFSISYDITEIKKEQLKTQESLVKEKEINFAQNQFINNSFNEIRKSLNLILGTTQLIRLYKTKLSSEQLVSHIGRIENYSKSINNLIEDLLVIVQSYSQDITLNLVPVNFQKLCQNIVETFQFGIGRNHLISFIVSDNLQQTYSQISNPKAGLKEKSLIYLDEKKVWKVINILLSNAIQYSKDQTHINIKLDYLEDHLKLLVQDQGIGIPTEEQELVFDPFYRGQNTETIPGLGIGLHLVKIYVELHGGQVMMSSLPGSGTTVQVSFPRHLKPHH